MSANGKGMDMMSEKNLMETIRHLRELWISNGYQKFLDFQLYLILGGEKFKLKDKYDFKLIIRALNLVLKENRRLKARIIHKIK